VDMRIGVVCMEGTGNDYSICCDLTAKVDHTILFLVTKKLWAITY